MTLRYMILEGVRQGFEDAWHKRCDGREDPEERCPMRPADGCLCYYRAYEAAPFWRRWRMEKPHRPTQEDVLQATFKQEIAHTIKENRHDRD